MPEGLEAEIWRRSLEGLVGSTITKVWADERSADPDVMSMLPGSVISRIDRLGKSSSLQPTVRPLACTSV